MIRDASDDKECVRRLGMRRTVRDVSDGLRKINLPFRPERFDTLPNTLSSAKEFTHWFKTFEHFMAVFPQDGLNKLKVMTHFLSPNVFQ